MPSKYVREHNQALIILMSPAVQTLCCLRKTPMRRGLCRRPCRGTARVLIQNSSKYKMEDQVLGISNPKVDINMTEIFLLLKNTFSVCSDVTSTSSSTSSQLLVVVASEDGQVSSGQELSLALNMPTLVLLPRNLRTDQQTNSTVSIIRKCTSQTSHVFISIFTDRLILSLSY